MSIRGRAALVAGLVFSAAVGSAVLAADGSEAPALTIERCVALALTDGPDAAANKDAARRAQLAHENALAAFKVGFSNNAGMSYSGTTEWTGMNAGLSLRLPFGKSLPTTGFFANSVAISAREVELAWEETQADLAKAKAAIALAAKKLYLQAYKDKRAYELALAKAERYRSTYLPDVKAKRANGWATETDVLRAEAQMALLDLNAKQASLAAESSETALAKATGLRAIGQLLPVAPDVAAIETVLASDPAELGAKAWSKSSDAAKAANDTERAAMNLAKAKMQLRPVVGVTANWLLSAEYEGLQADMQAKIADVVSGGVLTLSGNLSKASLARGDYWDIGIGVSSPLLLDWGVAKRNVELAEMAYEDAVKREAEAKQKKLDDVAAAHAALGSVWARWNLAEMNRKLDALALAEAETKLSAGMISKVEYAEKVAEVEDNEAARVALGHDVILAYENLMAVMGNM